MKYVSVLKRSHSEKATNCRVPAILHCGQDKMMGEKRSGVEGKGEINRWRHRGFVGNETTLYDMIVVDTCHYTCVQTHTLYNTRVNYDLNCGFG